MILTKLLIASKQYPLIGQLSTTREDMATFANPAYTLPFRNTNHLVYRDNWNIQLTKTGFYQCGRPLSGDAHGD